MVTTLAIALGGCSSDVNPMKAAMIDAGYGPKTVEAPEFIEKSRTGNRDYMTVGESAPKRPIRARSSDAQKTLEAELEGARSRNEARGKAAEGAAKGTAKGLKAPDAPAQ